MADTKLSALTELAATPAIDDEVYIRDVSEAAADESKRITITNLMGAAPTLLTSGSYAGNDAANRAIAHGLGKIPAIVFISNAETNQYRILPGTRLIHWTNGGAVTRTATTASDATNFYVPGGVAATGGNNSSVTFYWVAIG